LVQHSGKADTSEECTSYRGRRQVSGIYSYSHSDCLSYTDQHPNIHTDQYPYTHIYQHPYTHIYANSAFRGLGFLSRELALR
jgi:hypothetical protein